VARMTRASDDRRRPAVIAIALACLVIGGWLAAPDRAGAQIPDPGDIELPDPPDVDLPDVEVPEIEVPDIEVPDVPDVPDVDPPDPPDIDPDPDDDPGDGPGDESSGDPAPDKDGGGGPDGRHKNGHSPGRGDHPRGGGRATASTPAPPAHLAAARGDGDLVIVPSESGVQALSRPDDDGNTLLELLAPLGFPMLLMIAVGGWLTLQDHMERRNPKRLLDASDSIDRVGTS
jgi:hypothetical protein